MDTRPRPDALPILFDLVSDVGRYPEFVKWIRSLKCLSEQERGGNFRCRAETTVGFQALTETFVTDVEARRGELAIDVSLVRGPVHGRRSAAAAADSRGPV